MKVALPHRELQLFLTALVVLHLLPLFASLPVWVLFVALFLCAWKVLVWLRGIRDPRKFEIWFIGLTGMAFILLSKHTLFGEEAGGMVLALMAGCKLGESKTYRDYSITVILCFLLLMVYLLSSQSLMSLAYLIVDVILLVQFLLQLHPSGNARFSIRAVLRLLGFTLPLWALLFFVFPRFTVGFWHQETANVSTGFSDSLNPGAIERLAQSDEIAFRVRFEGLTVGPESLYWRGSVLTVTNGLEWSKGGMRYPLETATQLTTGKLNRYRLWLDPIFQRWLFTLDFSSPYDPPQISGHTVIPRGGLVYELARPAVARLSYQGSAISLSPELFLAEGEFRSSLQLPQNLSEDIKKLAEDLRDPQGNAEVSSRNLIRWFQKQRFHYSLNPGRSSTLSAFLFQTRLGFCEHFAAAGGVLMRAMGFPARVVVGFQGAEPNTFSDYWMVRNRNAHAWVEYFVLTDPKLKRGHWTRLDLVEAVTPVRMSLGADYFQAASRSGTDAEGLSLEVYRKQAGWFSRGRNGLRLAFDAAEMQWLRFLTDYDFQFQQSLFTRFGFQAASRTFFFSILGLGLFLWLIFFRIFQRRKLKSRDRWLELWREWSELFAREGLARRPAEGPLDFTERVRKQFPGFEKEIKEMSDCLIHYRYGPGSPKLSPQAIRLFKEKIARFKHEFFKK